MCMQEDYIDNAQIMKNMTQRKDTYKSCVNKDSYRNHIKLN